MATTEAQVLKDLLGAIGTASFPGSDRMVAILARRLAALSEATEDREPVVVAAGETLTLTRTEHQNRTITLAGAGASVTMDAAAMGAGFVCYVENATGSDWALPSFTGAAARFPRGASHTHLYDASGARLELVLVGGDLRAVWTGDTYDRPAGDSFTPLLTETPTDPGYADQWWLKSTAPGLGDMEGKVWPYHQGEGVKVLLLDSGVWYREEPSLPAGINGLRDLRDNYDTSLHLVYNGVTYDGTRKIGGGITSDGHGTNQAGVIAGAITGGGAIGVAPRATICCVHMYDPSTAVYVDGTDDAAIQAATSHGANFDVVYSKNRADASSLSWRAGLQLAIDTGRGGLGTIIVHPANNQNDDTGSTGCFPGTLTVTALEQDGTPNSTSSFASYALVAAPGPATGWVGSGVGSGGSGEDQWNVGGGFTSAASAVVAGICTLLVGVAPRLGWRDVHEVLALTARQTGSALAAAPTGNEDFPWVVNAATHWNGGGMRHSKDYGFGAVHAESAVRLAQSYRDLGIGGRGSANAVSYLSANYIPNLTVGGGTPTRTYNITVATEDDMVIERLLPLVFAGGSNRSAMELSITSPAGTTAHIGNLIVGSTLWVTTPTNRMPFHAEAFRGERLAGTWTFTMTAPVGNSNNWSVAQLGASGTSVVENIHHVVTDDLSVMVAADSGRSTIAAVGDDTLNGAALSGAATVNFISGAATLDGTSCTLDTPSGFGCFYGGAGDDTITCHHGGMMVFGGDGDDSIVGGNGPDTICGGPGGDTLTGGNGADVFLYRAVRDSLPSAPDTITDFLPGTDRVRLEISSLGVFIGSDEFHGRPYELRVVTEGLVTTAYYDTDGDAEADMVIEFSNGPVLSAGDFDFADPH